MEDEATTTRPDDFFGQPISTGDYVIGAQGHNLAIYKVLRMTPKMVRIAKITAKTAKAKKGALRYANELMKVDEKLVTFHLMKL